MLKAIGKRGIPSLSSDLTGDAAEALLLLRSISADIQATGFEFNTEHDFPLSLDEDGEAILPTNFLAFHAPAVDGGRGLVSRGNRIYDRLRHTYDLRGGSYLDTNGMIRANVVLQLEFDELSAALKAYIRVKATRTFIGIKRVSPVGVQLTENDELRAKAAFEQSAEPPEDNSLKHQNSWFARMTRRS